MLYGARRLSLGSATLCREPKHVNIRRPRKGLWKLHFPCKTPVFPAWGSCLTNPDRPWATRQQCPSWELPPDTGSWHVGSCRVWPEPAGWLRHPPSSPGVAVLLLRPRRVVTPGRKGGALPRLLGHQNSTRSLAPPPLPALFPHLQSGSSTRCVSAILRKGHS